MIPSHKCDIRLYFNFHNDTIIYANSKFKTLLDSIPKNKYIDVETEFRNRLDLVSLKIYGTFDLWWVLMYYNKIINPYDFNNSILYYIEKPELVELLDRSRLR